ncbi:MAG: DNA-binding response regulator [Elusimicrobia bacterium RIFOXYB2_FULL_49_7]|nr:MAG: DNA-binding response regulator [Elusimicrobia bacterium RIFOXYB2_FULL_49_7]
MSADSSLRILIVDDEPSVRRFLKASLCSQGYTVFQASNGQEALLEFSTCRPDAVILDLSLPDMDGIDVTRSIREHSGTPIIILSVRDGEKDKVTALDTGADDYLTKPFSEDEMLARIRAVLRRLRSASEEPVFQSGHLSVDLAKREVAVKETPANLTPTEYDVLKILVLNAGKVVTRKQIYKAIWNKDEDCEGISHLLRVTISNLRTKLESKPHIPALIITEPGVGYRLRTD